MVLSLLVEVKRGVRTAMKRIDVSMPVWHAELASEFVQTLQVRILRSGAPWDGRGSAA